MIFEPVSRRAFNRPAGEFLSVFYRFHPLHGHFSAAQNPPEEYTNLPQNGILEADPPVQQPVLPAQTTVDTAPVSTRARLFLHGWIHWEWC